MDGDDVEARLDAIERALADGDADLTAITEAAERERELDELRERVEDLESEVTELAASVQAVRGYVGNVRTVNRDVERRADAALAKVEELERHGPDRDGRHSPERAESGTRGGSGRDGRPGDDGPPNRRSRATGRDDDRTESPGDIARRITGRDGHERGRRPPRDGGGRGGEHRDSGTDGRSQNGSSPAASSRGNDDEDGFLSGLRDAL